jgi:signal transduction histidine kinase/ligand-binding sensor domain-containing protein/CheY-like chemotaxis protein
MNGKSLGPGIILIALSLFTPSAAQFPKLNFRNLTVKDGLNQNYVKSIIQDENGFMWFGSPEGVDKFDGTGFVSYHALFFDSLTSNYQNTYDILEDSEGLFWISTYSNGIILFDKNKETIARYKNEPTNPQSLRSNRVLKVFEDSRKNIWVATAGGGLNLWHRDSKTFTAYLHDEKNTRSIGSDYISSITEDRYGSLWLASYDGLLIRLDVTAGLFENYMLPVPEHNIILARSNVPVVFADSEDNICVGSMYGLSMLSIKSGELRHYSKLNPKSKVSLYITSIIEYEKGIYAIATNGDGLYLYNIHSGDYVNYSNEKSADFYINSNSLTSLYKSQDGSLWVGSFNGGVFMQNKAFSQFALLKDLVQDSNRDLLKNQINTFCIVPDGKIWMGTSAGIIVYDTATHSIQNLSWLAKSGITSLFCNRTKQIYIGTRSNGLFVYDWEGKNYQQVNLGAQNKNSAAPEAISSVIEDTDGNIWIAYSGFGIELWERNSSRLTRFRYQVNDPNSLNSDVVFKIIEDRQNTVWAGTSGGLCYYNKEQRKFVRFPLYLRKGSDQMVSTVLDINLDTKGNLWVGTDKAVYLINHATRTATSFYPASVPVSFLLLNINEDQQGMIWMTAYNNLLKLNPVTGQFITYNITEGFVEPSFMRHASLSYNGRFYLGSMEGVYTFKPADIEDENKLPGIFLTEIRINNQRISPQSEGAILSDNINFTKEIRLRNRQSTFTLVFAALEYIHPEKINYSYKLDDYDNDWINSGNLNRATYTRVPPGTYVFRVRAASKMGEWTDPGTQLTIKILAPFWHTWWFRLAMALMIVALLLYIFNSRNKAVIRQKRELEVKVNERTKQLNEANISLSDQREELKQQNELLSQMSEKILQQNKELEQHYSDLGELIEERTRELEKAKNKAEESDKLKSAFLANMSHEIRTPMNAIVGFANLLKDEDITQHEKIEFVEIINSNSDMLLVLIDDILDLSLIEADQLIIRKEIIVLNEFLDHLYSAFSLMNSKNEIDVVLNNEMYASDLRILCDKIRLKQILSNLMSNALKFTETGRVELEFAWRNHRLEFIVKDTGIGIPRSELTNIFDRFRKSDYGQQVIYRGTGLGLTISKALAILLGGDITVESQLGKGSVFTLTLPENIICQDDPTINQIKLFTHTSNPMMKNILIVEDEKANYMYVKMMLGGNDLNVHWAENGVDAVKLVESGIPFHLILMDIKMPAMDGFEATKVIKSSKPDQVVIALTAYARPEDRLRFMEAGFDDYLTKPIKPSDFRGVISRYL